VGWKVDTVSYNGAFADDKDAIGEVYQVKRTAHGELSRASVVGGGVRDLGALDVTLLVSVAVWMPGDKRLSITFDECPTAEVTADDVRAAVSDASGVPLARVHLVRVYPTLRPVRFREGDLLFGFEGTKERGLWTKAPYPGPVRPATIPTPLAMRFKMVDEAEVRFLEREEQWWEQMKEQAGWFGHMERLAGQREELDIKLNPPRQPQVRLGGWCCGCGHLRDVCVMFDCVGV
jgi:hypothetical protein